MATGDCVGFSAALLVGRDEPAWVTEPDWAWECQLP